mmetsp:Transcript_15841/g.33544  ORF Transcript_15841/g.33544 Transcript_15841/m.33544 type:complete len:326 (-) Transcript_15841:697-1674(-)
MWRRHARPRARGTARPSCRAASSCRPCSRSSRGSRQTPLPASVAPPSRSTLGRRGHRPQPHFCCGAGPPATRSAGVSTGHQSWAACPREWRPEAPARAPKRRCLASPPPRAATVLPPDPKPRRCRHWSTKRHPGYSGCCILAQATATSEQGACIGWVCPRLLCAPRHRTRRNLARLSSARSAALRCEAQTVRHLWGSCRWASEPGATWLRPRPQNSDYSPPGLRPLPRCLALDLRARHQSRPTHRGACPMRVECLPRLGCKRGPLVQHRHRPPLPMLHCHDYRHVCHRGDAHQVRRRRRAALRRHGIPGCSRQAIRGRCKARAVA